MAKKFGLSHGFNSNKTSDLNQEIKKIVGLMGADVVIDTTGIASVIEQAYELTHPDGKTILVGVPAKGDNISINSLPLHFSKILIGSHGGDAIPDLEIPRYIKLIRAGKITLDGIITHEFSLDEINDAIEQVRSGEAGRVLVAME
jgi:S-(hydroxymethyl)glutathione dehydrogenase/alcohol dehydrogenase